ncbi:MAG: GNAT family N-acetyltransferase [Bacteroidales bacterium]|nr:GNAT family N-acetyltransferase [Candidatus Colicola faecequi]
MKLRALEIEDLPYLYQWENDARAWGDSEIHNPLSHKLLREYIESASGDIYKDGQLRLIVEENGATIGVVDLFDFDPRSRKAAIGMYIAPECRSCGLGAKSLQLLEDYSFEFLGLHQIYAIIAEDNAACVRIFDAAGYLRSSLLKDWVVRSNGYSDAVVFQKIK